MERRRLVGRRYEDYLRNRIFIELTPEEHLLRMFISDPRYNALVERRKKVRRQADRALQIQPNFFLPGGPLSLSSEIVELAFYEDLE